MSHWIVNFFMSLMHVFSSDNNFPSYNDLTAALETPATKRTATMKKTIQHAQVYFYVCPGSLDVLPPEFLNKVDAAFDREFVHLIGRIGPFQKEEWRKSHSSYRAQICQELNSLIARRALTGVLIPERASARMYYYLEKLSANMYIPTASALVKTAEVLLGVGLGICEVSKRASRCRGRLTVWRRWRHGLLVHQFLPGGLMGVVLTEFAMQANIYTLHCESCRPLGHTLNLDGGLWIRRS